MSEELRSQTDLPKSQTGISGLDIILAGGFAKGGLYLIEGAAGAGKTVLANQIAFEYARSDENVIYLTLLAESHGKLLHHLRHFDFYDATYVTHRVFYISGYTELLESGLNGLLELLASLIAKYNPSLLVIDGFRSARDFFATELELAKFVHELNTFVTAADCTTILLSPPDSTHAQPEQILVDGLIELSQVECGMRSLRFLEVHKVRGASYLRGKHSFCVSEKGIEVFPRLESWRPQEGSSFGLGERGRKAFGLPLLDERLDGGLIERSLNRIDGPSDSGKTLLALQFLEAGAAAGERGCLCSFRESVSELFLKAESMGLDLRSRAEGAEPSILIQSNVYGETLADEVAKRLIDALRGQRIRRLVLDGLYHIEDVSFAVERRVLFYRSLVRHVQSLGVTTLLLTGAPACVAADDPAIRFDQTLLLEWEGKFNANTRRIQVLKGFIHEAVADELMLSRGGLSVKRRDQRLDSKDHWLSSRQQYGFVHSAVSRVRDSTLRTFKRP